MQRESRTWKMDQGHFCPFFFEYRRKKGKREKKRKWQLKQNAHVWVGIFVKSTIGGDFVNLEICWHSFSKMFIGVRFVYICSLGWACVHVECCVCTCVIHTHKKDWHSNLILAQKINYRTSFIVFLKTCPALWLLNLNYLSLLWTQYSSYFHVDAIISVIISLCWWLRACFVELWLLEKLLWAAGCGKAAVSCRPWESWNPCYWTTVASKKITIRLSYLRVDPTCHP